MVELLEFIEPIRKKWVYHFIVSPKTSDIEKPEWYLSQTRKWIYENIDSVEAKVTADPKHKICPHVKHQFMLCLMELAMGRLKKDMIKVTSFIDEEIQYEAILIHTYNEVILFTKTIRRLLGECYSNITDRYDLLSVFSSQKLFETIIDVEYEYADKNLKDITTSPFKWDSVLEGDFADSYKIPKCVDRFLLLNKSLTERVECFRQIDCQLQLIDLQCDLFKKFLKFLQAEECEPRVTTLLTGFLAGGETTINVTRKLHILNAVNFLRLILKDRNFIPSSVMADLDVTLLEKSEKLAKDYSRCFDKLIIDVVSLYQSHVIDDHQDLLNFIRPKLSYQIYEIIRDDVAKIYQERHTQNLLGGLTFKQE